MKSNIVKKETSLKYKTSKLYQKKEPVTDYESVITSGMLIEDMTILTEFKTTNKTIRWYCCLMIHKHIKLLQEEKNFKDVDIMKIFDARNLKKTKVIEILQEVKSRQAIYDEE